MIIGEFGETFPPMLDGVGRVMYAYCTTLDKQGHTTYYIAPWDSKHSVFPDLRAIHYFGWHVPLQPYHFGFPMLSPAWRKAEKEIRFDVVHAHAPFLAGKAARHYARKYNVPLVGTFHSKFRDDFTRAVHFKFLVNIAMSYVMSFYNSCDEVWAVNEASADVFREYGYKGYIHIMPNGTDTMAVTDEEYAATLKKYPVRRDVPVLLFVGQMDFKKNTRRILEAAALLKKRGVKFQLVMAGQGQDMIALKLLAKQKGLGRDVLFTDFVSDHSEILSLYKAADLFVFPSVYDNAPMVVREAASMGTAAVLVRGSCSAERVVDGENGFLCEDTTESVAEAIRRGLAKSKEAGELAQKTIPLPWDEIMRRATARYQYLIDQKKTKS